jgi:ABC-type multidrug transport system fused ATPase/permease subunit
MKGKTTISITHRLENLGVYDRIVVINKGRVEESGTEEELLLKKGYLFNAEKNNKKILD